MTFSTIPWNKDIDDFGLGIAKATQTRRKFAINTDKLETTEIGDLPAGNTLAFKSTLAKSAKDINEHFEINASASFHATFEEFGGRGRRSHQSTSTICSSTVMISSFSARASSDTPWIT